MNKNTILVLPQKVITKWNGANKKYYESKGYIFTKNGEEFEINVLDLVPTSGIMVKCYCAKCKSIIMKKYCLINNHVLCDSCRSNNETPLRDITGENIKKNIIYPQYIKMKWHKLYKAYYESKGYIFTNYKDTFDVDVLDLPQGSSKKIKCKCKYCNNIIEKPVKYISKNYDNICCYNCKNNKTIITNQNRYGVNSTGELEWVKEKARKTNLKKYGYKYTTQVPEIKTKMIKNALKTKYNNGTNITSKPQIHIHKLIGGEHCYPIDKLVLDIAFPDEMIYVEYNGSGHDLCTKYGYTKKQFNNKELRRQKFLERLGWKIIIIECKNDKLLSDARMIELINISKNYLLNTNHTWIIIDINKMKIICKEFEKYTIFFGNNDKMDELARISLINNLIQRYNSAGELTETGRTFKLSVEDEELIAKKRDEVAPELKKYPKIQEYLLNQIKTGVEPINYEKDETDDMTEEEFEKSLNEDNDGAEETENWNDI